jgi:hypothetical protein
VREKGKGHKGRWHLAAFPFRFAAWNLAPWSARPTPLRSPLPTLSLRSVSGSPSPSSLALLGPLLRRFAPCPETPRRWRSRVPSADATTSLRSTVDTVVGLSLPVAEPGRGNAADVARGRADGPSHRRFSLSLEGLVADVRDFRVGTTRWRYTRARRFLKSEADSAEIIFRNICTMISEADSLRAHPCATAVLATPVGRRVDVDCEAPSCTHQIYRIQTM